MASSNKSKGIIKVLDSKDNSYYTAQDVMILLGVKRGKAYEVIRELRQELIDSGKLADCYPNGKVPKKYFEERCYM